ncbi:MAG: ATP-dependent sacrificial sulfur transferase LarE [Anaerococcus sp.]
MNLKNFFKKYNKVAIAFSGGVDSAYLLYEAVKNKVDVQAYYVKSAFQPQFELDDAINLVEKLDAKMKILEADVFEESNILKNSEIRCYHCKTKIFSTIKNEAIKDGYEILLDGTNASDAYDDRPGMKAKDELEVLSPLRMCGLTKDEIRKKSRKARLETWDKPSYSCLATRIMTDTPITKEKLTNTEKAEDFMRKKGFVDFRVRNVNSSAKIQVKANQFEKVLELRNEILEELKKYYVNVLLDLEER